VVGDPSLLMVGAQFKMAGSCLKEESAESGACPNAKEKDGFDFAYYKGAVKRKKRHAF